MGGEGVNLEQQKSEQIHVEDTEAGPSLSSGLTAYPDRIIHRSSGSYTNISMDAVDAVEFSREQWNSLMTIGAIIGLLGALAVLAGSWGGGSLFVIVGALLFIVGLGMRKEQIVIITPGEKFSYETRSSQGGKEAADEICMLRDKYKNNR